MTNWQSIETAPKDGLILIAWCSNASGILEYDIVAFRHPQKYGDAFKSTPGIEEYEGQFSKFLYPKRGYTILGWMPLPAFP